MLAGLVLLDLVLHELGLNLEVAQLLAQTLCLDAQLLTLLLALLHLFVHDDATLNGLIELGLHVLERRGGIARLALKVVVGHFGVAQLHLKAAVCVAEDGDFLFEDILRRRGFSLGLFVFALQMLAEHMAMWEHGSYLPLFHLESESLCLFLKDSLLLFCSLNILFQLLLELTTRVAKFGELNLKLHILRLVPRERILYCGGLAGRG